MKISNFNFFLNNYVLYNRLGQIFLKKHFISRFNVYYFKYLLKSL